MGTAHYSGRLSCHARPPPFDMHARVATHIPLSPCMPLLTTQAPQGMNAPNAWMPPVDRILDTHLRKHYLPETTVAGAKNLLDQVLTPGHLLSCQSL